VIRLIFAIPPLVLSDALRVSSDILFNLGTTVAGSTLTRR